MILVQPLPSFKRSLRLVHLPSLIHYNSSAYFCCLGYVLFYIVCFVHCLVFNRAYSLSFVQGNRKCSLGLLPGCACLYLYWVN